MVKKSIRAIVAGTGFEGRAARMRRFCEDGAGFFMGALQIKVQLALPTTKSVADTSRVFRIHQTTCQPTTVVL
jgi:hypothetical protein